MERRICMPAVFVGVNHSNYSSSSAVELSVLAWKSSSMPKLSEAFLMQCCRGIIKLLHTWRQFLNKIKWPHSQRVFRNITSFLKTLQLCNATSANRYIHIHVYCTCSHIHVGEWSKRFKGFFHLNLNPKKYYCQIYNMLAKIDDSILTGVIVTKSPRISSRWAEAPVKVSLFKIRQKPQTYKGPTDDCLHS